MQCIDTRTVSNREFMLRFNHEVLERRIPLTGSFDLTHRCNLRCIHCYVSDLGGARCETNAELNTGRWLEIIDEITEAGCLYLLLTGGEPLLRKDFAEIYRHAKLRGLLVTVFTNGTLIAEHILDTFKEFPPDVVEISLYGATPETYQRITGVRGSYEQCRGGIRKLLDRKIRVTLKTVLMTCNRHEVHEIESIAKSSGARFRCDSALFPRLNGDKTPIRLRVAPEEAVAYEFSDSQRLHHWYEYFKRTKGLPALESLYDCGAGLTSFHIDPYGNLQPCTMVDDIKYRLSGETFHAQWRRVSSAIQQKKADTQLICRRCEKSTLCGYCPAFFRLENGSDGILSEYLCAIGSLRFKALSGLTE